jgi:DNA primase
VGLCPFHSERTPSFQVLAERGFYHCFGCGKHGDAFTWLMEREGLAFPEAMEQLAQAAGIEVPKQRERPAAELDLEARLRLAMEAAQAFYQRRLTESAKAMDYLKGRGMTEAFILESGLGYAPDAWEALMNHLKTQGFSPELAEQAGLVSRSERGNHIDFLRDRLIIPILDARGRVIAFGGRAFGAAQPKYMNTRETPLFSKGSVLFGFHRAKGQLRDGALMVEGYFDVLQLHQQGLNQAVAPLGTALTEGHLQLVGRFTKRVILCFDGDAAGLRAMEKGLKLALPMGFDVRLLLLPQGEDPDTWCLALGAEAFRELIRQAPDWTNFIINRAMQDKDLKRIRLVLQPGPLAGSSPFRTGPGGQGPDRAKGGDRHPGSAPGRGGRPASPHPHPVPGSSHS